MIHVRVNQGIIRLQITPTNQDGSAHVMTSGSVRVYQVSGAGVESINLAATPLVDASPAGWRYQWQPATISEGMYVVEYTMTDASQTYAPVTEDLHVWTQDAVDVETGCAGALAAYGTLGVAVSGEAADALSSYGAATGANVTDAVAALQGIDGDTLETLSDQIDVIQERTDNLPDDPASGADLALVAADVAILKQIGIGRWKILDNQMILYAADGATALYTFNLKDDSGTANMERVFERVPV